MDRYVAIGEASVALGVSITTLRRWEAEGKLIPERTAGRQRRYDLAKLKPELFLGAPQDRKTIAYARVSSHDQKDDLERQKQVLELYCAKQGWTFEVIADLGSGMNYNKEGAQEAQRVRRPSRSRRAVCFVGAGGVCRRRQNRRHRYGVQSLGSQSPRYS